MNSIDELNNLMKDVHKAKENPLYQGWYEFLKITKEKLETEKFKLVFIGTKGHGKTTAILELFGLNKMINKKIEELLLTGPGGTTVCEVEILESSKPFTYFDIEPVTPQLFDQYVNDFCLLYDFGDEDTSNDPPPYVPTEIKRSLRVMMRLQEKDVEKLSKEFKVRDAFKKEILRRINCQKRTRTIIECEKNNGTFFEDCQSKFETISLCKLDDVMLPKRIKIFLTKDILDFGEEAFISSIIDTRGIDTTLSSSSDANKMKREDILDYIDKEQKNCLFFFVDRFISVPSQSISELLRSRVQIGNEFRFYLLVNIEKNQAEEVLTDEGKAGTIQAGIDYRKGDVLDKFKQLKIRFDDQNVLFYNAKENFPSNNELLKCIEDNLNTKRNKLWEDCAVIKRDFSRQKHSFEDHKYALDRFEQLWKDIEKVHAPEKVFDQLLSAFVGVLQNIHPKRLDAVNRNHGDYYAFNFFHEISLVVENLFDDFFYYAKDKIINKVSEFVKFRGITELDAIHYRAFLEKFENDYSHYRSQLKEYIKSELKQRFQERTWNQAVEEFGKRIKKPTYRDRVVEIYKEELKRFASQINVRDNYNNRWNKVKENPLS